MKRKTVSVGERLSRSYKVNDSGCWIWQLGCDQYGYGQIKVDGSTKGAHRVS